MIVLIKSACALLLFPVAIIAAILIRFLDRVCWGYDWLLSDTVRRRMPDDRMLTLLDQVLTFAGGVVCGAVIWWGAS